MDEPESTYYIDSLSSEGRWEYLMGRQLAMESALGLIAIALSGAVRDHSGTRSLIVGYLQGAGDGIRDLPEIPQILMRGHSDTMNKLISSLT